MVDNRERAVMAKACISDVMIHSGLEEREDCHTILLFFCHGDGEVRGGER